MGLQSLWTIATGAGDMTLSQQIFLIVFLAIVIGWIVIALWTRTLDNFTYSFLGMNDNSLWDTFLIAIGVTIIFITLVWVVDTYDVVEGGLGRDVVAEKDPFFNNAEETGPISLPASVNINDPAITTLFPGIIFR